ncbi:hypothetical protein EKO27_g3077 [Xylaria grammica]|uniref:Uncharacterized protein n=1 Tax=Xylaria grammica TaxID=363999 RepID=A0A439DC99_9PEZI|nr:hypothetical protein EKO27_g3077 [Xylaria grammica]
MDGPNDQSVENGISNSLSSLAKILPELSVIEEKARELAIIEKRVGELEVAKIKAEEIAQDWARKYETTEEQLRKMEKEYEKQASQNWALDNKLKDKSVEIRILQLALQNSIPLADWEHPPPKLRTALEFAQQKTIEDLQKELEGLRERPDHPEKDKLD